MKFSELPSQVKRSRLISLAFATPYLLLIIPSIIEAGRSLPRFDALGHIGVETTFVLCYIAVWLSVDTPPRVRKISRIHLTYYVLLASLYLISLSFWQWGTIANYTYLVAAVYLTIPRRYLWQSLLVMIGMFASTVIFSQRVKVESAQLYAFVVVSVIVTIMLILVRAAMDSTMHQENTLIAEKASAVQRERARMAGNLHDRLGQTLTAINTIAQVSTRCARAGKAQEAAERSEQIAELASQALREVRQVVRSDTHLTIAQELQCARVLLEAADIALHSKVNVNNLPTEIEDAFAQVIKEGSANIVHHSAATFAVITVDNSGVEVRDSGPARAKSNRDSFGINALTHRLAHCGTVSAGPCGNGWKLCLRVDKFSS